METPEQTKRLNKTAETIANLVEEEAWEHMSLADSEKALDALRELLANF